jgi:hypothetical protein
MANVSPLPKKGKVQKVDEQAAKNVTENITEKVIEKSDVAYSFELQFNDKAELINVSCPKDMSIARMNNHFAVGMLYLAQELVKLTEK